MSLNNHKARWAAKNPTIAVIDRPTTSLISIWVLSVITERLSNP
ncbi:MAG: hypothetical protein ACRDTN_10350 [Mycobacterium sp.]